jgi:hypothetical protein
MLLLVSTVACSMLFSCGDEVCGEQGFDVVETSDPIVDVVASDVACLGVTPPCVASDDAGTCARFYVIPTDTGNCHVDVHLAKGTTFSTDVKIVRGSGSCPGFFPAVAADAIVEVP